MNKSPVNPTRLLFNSDDRDPGGIKATSRWAGKAKRTKRDDAVRARRSELRDSTILPPGSALPLYHFDFLPP